MNTYADIVKGEAAGAWPQPDHWWGGVTSDGLRHARPDDAIEDELERQTFDGRAPSVVEVSVGHLDPDPDPGDVEEDSYGEELRPCDWTSTFMVDVAEWRAAQDVVG